MSGGNNGADLVAQAISGDRVALQKLLLRHSAQLSRHIAQKLPASVQAVVDAEDVLQQTFLDAYRTIGKFEPREDHSFLAWLKTIATNTAQDAVKGLKRAKRGGNRQRIDRVPGSQSRSYVDLVELLSVGGHTPSRSVAGHEAVQAIQKVVQGLSDDYQRAVKLRLLEGKTLEETAAAMNRSTRAVQGLVDRAKKKMRAVLGSLSLYE